MKGSVHYLVPLKRIKVAKKDDLIKCFGGSGDQTEVCKEILSKGDLQVRARAALGGGAPPIIRGQSEANLSCEC